MTGFLAVVSPFVALLVVALGWGLERRGRASERRREAEIAGLIAAMTSLEAAYLDSREILMMFLAHRSGDVAVDPEGEDKSVQLDAIVARWEDEKRALTIAREQVSHDGLRGRIHRFQAEMNAHVKKVIGAPYGDPSTWLEDRNREREEQLAEHSKLIADLGVELRAIR